MRRIFVCLQHPRVVLADIIYRKSSNVDYYNETLQSVVIKDMARYKSKRSNLSGIKLFNELLLSNKIFRTQWFFRMGQSEKLRSSVLLTFSRMLLRPLDNLEIGINKTGYIGGGLKIIHKSGCVLSAHEAGENLTIYQGVTIGDDGSNVNEAGFKNPVFGNNVVVYANAVVVGGITVGDNVVIGAGSIVRKSVPSNCKVVGNPARIVELNGEKVCKKL